jgi:hypothetical protein
MADPHVLTGLIAKRAKIKDFATWVSDTVEALHLGERTTIPSGKLPANFAATTPRTNRCAVAVRLVIGSGVIPPRAPETIEAGRRCVVTMRAVPTEGGSLRGGKRQSATRNNQNRNDTPAHFQRSSGVICRACLA